MIALHELRRSNSRDYLRNHPPHQLHRAKTDQSPQLSQKVARTIKICRIHHSLLLPPKTSGNRTSFQMQTAETFSQCRLHHRLVGILHLSNSSSYNPITQLSRQLNQIGTMDINNSRCQIQVVSDTSHLNSKIKISQIHRLNPFSHPL